MERHYNPMLLLVLYTCTHKNLTLHEYIIASDYLQNFKCLLRHNCKELMKHENLTLQLCYAIMLSKPMVMNDCTRNLLAVPTKLISKLIGTLRSEGKLELADW